MFSGPKQVLTETLIEHSAFCWASAHLRADLNILEHQVKLCNGIKASRFSFLENSLTPLHDHSEEIALPSMPQQRFWPSMFVSAAEPEKKAKSKKTEQPGSARKDRVYGKKGSVRGQEEVKGEKSGEKTEKVKKQGKHGEDEGEDHKDKLPVGDKLECKYRKSCYKEEEPPTAEEIAQKYSKSSHEEDVDDYEHPKSTSSPSSKASADDKLQCKYRKACYEEKGISTGENKPIHHHVLSSRAHDHDVEHGQQKTLKKAVEKALKDVKKQEKFGKEHKVAPNYEAILKVSFYFFGV